MALSALIFVLVTLTLASGFYLVSTRWGRDASLVRQRMESEFRRDQEAQPASSPLFKNLERLDLDRPTIDLMEDAWATDVPHEAFTWLRANAPVYWHDLDGEKAPGFWAVSRKKAGMESGRTGAAITRSSSAPSVRASSMLHSTKATGRGLSMICRGVSRHARK